MLQNRAIPITKIKWPIPNPSPGEESPFRRSPKPPPKGKRGKAYTIVGSEQAEKIKAMEAKEKAKHPGEPLFAHPLYRPKPAMGFQTSSGKKDTRETGDPHEPYEDKGTLGFKRSFLKARILKAFGVPISMPGGKQRILPINRNSEGGFFIKETSGRHSLHPVARRPKTVTEKERDSHADGGEKNFSGARGATPALLGMIKAGEKIKKIKDMTSEELVQAHKDGTIRINRSYRPGQSQHPEYAVEQAKIDENVELIDKALLWPAHKKEQQGGRKVKTRVGDSIGGYPT